MESNSCCGLKLSNRQTLIINSIYPSNNNHLQPSVTYTFNFTTSLVNLITSDIIQITFPPEYYTTIKSSNNLTLCSGLTIVGSNYNSSFKTATCNIDLNSLIISSFLTTNLPGSETIIVKLLGVQNPSSTPASFIISTLSSANYVL